MHPLEYIRKTATGALKAGSITVDVAGAPKPVGIYDQPPRGGEIPEKHLPGIYCFCRSEQVERASLDRLKRTVLLDFVIEARGTGEEPLDQLDDITLQLERVMAGLATPADKRLRFLLSGSEINVVRGEVVFAARRVTYEVIYRGSSGDPDVTV